MRLVIVAEEVAAGISSGVADEGRIKAATEFVAPRLADLLVETK